MNGPIKNALAVQKTNFLIICAIEVQTVIEIHEPGTGTFPDEVMTSVEKLVFMFIKENFNLPNLQSIHAFFNILLDSDKITNNYLTVIFLIPVSKSDFSFHSSSELNSLFSLEESFEKHL